MSQPVITFAHNFTPNRIASLVEINNTTERNPLIEDTLSQDPAIMQYEQPGLLPSMFVNGTFASTKWEMINGAALGQWSILVTSPTGSAPVAGGTMTQGAATATVSITPAAWTGPTTLYFYAKTGTFITGAVTFTGGGGGQITGDLSYATTVAGGIVLTSVGAAVRTDAYEHIYPGCKYRLYILATPITGQPTTTEVSCVITTGASETISKSFVNSAGEKVYVPTGPNTAAPLTMFKFDFIVPLGRPVLNISIQSAVPLTVINDAYLVNLDLLYSDRLIDDEPAFYQYQALWNHAPKTGSQPTLVGPYGETVPDTEYSFEYSQLPYEYSPRYALTRTWSPTVGATECTIRLVLSDRLLESYGEKPLYLQYNKTLNGQTHIGFREMVDPVALEPLPWTIAHARLLDYNGLRSGWSGYYLRTIRPKMNFIFKPVLVLVSGHYVYPHSLGPIYYSTPEHHLQPSYRDTDYTKVSWELPQLIDNVTMNLDDGIVINRKAYPDNSIVVLQDKDPVDGTRLPLGWGWRSGSSPTGSVLVSVNDRGLLSESIIGIDSKHGLVVCGENLENKDLWVSYLRDKSWWTFDRPTIFGTQSLLPNPNISVALLPTWAYVATHVEGDTYILVSGAPGNPETPDIVYVPTRRVVRDFPESIYPIADILNTIGTKLVVWGGVGPGVFEPDSIGLINYDPGTTLEATGSDYIKLEFALVKGVAASIAAHANRKISLTPIVHEDYKVLYGITSGLTTTWLTARQPLYNETEPTIYDVVLNPYPLGPIINISSDCLYNINKINIGTYQLPAETTADYKATQIAVSGGGMLPDQYYKPGQVHRLYPFHDHFADIGRWYPLQYQADSTMVASIRTDWLHYMANKLDKNLRPPVCVGDSYHQLSSWVLHGVNETNSNSYVLYWALKDGGGGPEVTLYKESAHTTIVGYGYCTMPTGTIVFVDTGAGITGQVIVNYLDVDMDSSNTLTVPEDTTRERLVSQVETVLNKYCSYGAFVDTVTVPFRRFLTDTGHGETLGDAATEESNNTYTILDSLINYPVYSGANEVDTP
jgi:hypothetical protein